MTYFPTTPYPTKALAHEAAIAAHRDHYGITHIEAQEIVRQLLAWGDLVLLGNNELLPLVTPPASTSWTIHDFRDEPLADRGHYPERFTDDR